MFSAGPAITRVNEARSSVGAYSDRVRCKIASMSARP
jgi:hypothetical protein